MENNFPQELSFDETEVGHAGWFGYFGLMNDGLPTPINISFKNDEEREKAALIGKEICRRWNAAPQPPQAASGRERALAEMPNYIRLTDGYVGDGHDCLMWFLNHADTICEALTTPPAVQGQGEAVREIDQAKFAQGHNGCLRVTVEALRYLANRAKPSGGSDRYNSEHLLQLADEIGQTQIDLIKLRALPSEAPPAGIDVEALRKDLYLTCYYPDYEVSPEDGYGIIDRVVDRLLLTNRLQSVQPAKESE